MATQGFLDLPELVEQMLLHLPLKQILRVQAVDRGWHALIKNSPKLQEALFLRPSQDTTLVLSDVTVTTVSTCKCKAEAIGQACDLQPTPTTSWTRNDNGQPSGRIVVSPFLDVQQHVMCNFPSPAGLSISPMLKGYGPNSSLLNTLITQPPVREVYLQPARLSHWHKVVASQSSFGVTLGDLAAAVGVANAVNAGDRMRVWKSGCFELINGTTNAAEKDCTALDVVYELHANLPSDSDIERALQRVTRESYNEGWGSVLMPRIRADVEVQLGLHPRFLSRDNWFARCYLIAHKALDYGDTAV